MNNKAVLLAVAGVAAAVVLVAWVVTGPPKEGTVEEVIALCTGGTKTAADFGLKAGVTDSSLQVGAVMNSKFGEIAKYATDPEATKQQFQYLACIDRRMAERQATKLQQPDSCTEKDYCVDLVRVADFTKSQCGAPGTARRDFVTLEDSVTVTPAAVPVYVASAQPSGKAKLEVTRTDKGNVVPVPGVFAEGAASTPSAYPIAHYNIPLTNGKAQYTWNWTDGHSDDRDGLVVKTVARLKNLHAQVLLPNGVTMKSLPVVPPSAAAKCIVGYNNIVCRDLESPESREMLKWFWDWNMWDRCAVAPATASTAPSASVPSAAADTSSLGESVAPSATAEAAASAVARAVSAATGPR